MGGVVLAVSKRPETVNAVLSGAARLLSITGGGTIQALAVRTPPVAELMMADQALTHAEEARLPHPKEAWASGVRAMTGRWLAETDMKAFAFRFIDTEGDIAHLVAGTGAAAIPPLSRAARTHPARRATRCTPRSSTHRVPCLSLHRKARANSGAWLPSPGKTMCARRKPCWPRCRFSPRPRRCMCCAHAWTKRYGAGHPGGARHQGTGPCRARPRPGWRAAFGARS